MPHKHSYGFPSRAALVRFLSERSPVTFDEAARLLGTTARRMRRLAREHEALLPGGRMTWEAVAFELFEVWPRALVLDTLGDAAGLVPRDLQLTRPEWHIPIYVVRAMEEQARLCNRGVGDHVADILHQAIDPDAIATLRRDAAFAAAYDFPQGPEGV